MQTQPVLESGRGNLMLRFEAFFLLLILFIMHNFAAFSAPDYARAGMPSGSRAVIFNAPRLTTTPAATDPATNTQTQSTGAATSYNTAADVGAQPAVADSATTVPSVSAADLAAKTAERDSLAAQLKGLRDENSRCEKSKTGWVAATVVGGIGVVGTTAGAIYQGLDWKKKNEELKGINTQIDDANAKIDSSGASAGGTQ